MAESAITIRVNAVSMALETNRGKSIPVDKILDDAKAIEKFIWGGLGPIEKSPTPYSTIDEAARATRDTILEYAHNHANPIKVEQLNSLLGTWERFSADLANILSDQV